MVTNTRYEFVKVASSVYYDQTDGTCINQDKFCYISFIGTSLVVITVDRYSPEADKLFKSNSYIDYVQALLILGIYKRYIDIQIGKC